MGHEYEKLQKQMPKGWTLYSRYDYEKHEAQFVAESPSGALVGPCPSPERALIMARKLAKHKDHPMNQKKEVNK